MSQLNLTEVITTGVLRLILHGFFLRTGLSASLYVNIDSEYPIYNKMDSHSFCRFQRDPSNESGCLKRNANLAKRVLEDSNMEALERLKICPFGLIHGAEVIKHWENNKIIAVMYFGGVITDKTKIHKFDEQHRKNIYMDQNKLEEGMSEFKSFATHLEGYYNHHLIIQNYSEGKRIRMAYESPESDIPIYLDYLLHDLDKSFDHLLDFLSEWTGSELSALCILNKGDQTGEFKKKPQLVVRRVRGLEDVLNRANSSIDVSETISFNDSFIGRAILRQELTYEPKFDPKSMAWENIVRLLSTRRALALPLILPSADGGDKEILGGLICFPSRNIWEGEYPEFERFAKKVSISVYLALRNEYYERSLAFRRGLMSILAEAGDNLYSDLASLISHNLPADETHVFFVDNQTGSLKLEGTSSERPEILEKIGKKVFPIGKGITGSIAAMQSEQPFGEIVYNINEDPRRSELFDQDVEGIAGRSQSAIFTQIRHFDGKIVGVVRCVGYKKEPRAVLNCFSHFTLEVLQFWAGILGIIYTLRDKTHFKWSFVNTFVHEFGSHLHAAKGSLDYARELFNQNKTSAGLRRLKDGLMYVSDTLPQYVEDVRLGALGAEGKEIDLKLSDEEWYNVEEDFLMPLKNAFFDETRRERDVDIYYETPRVSIFVDKKRFFQVLVNLMKNAIKYSYDPKSPHVSKEIRRNIKIFVELDKQENLYFRFINSGIGIPEEEREHIFDAYRKGKNVASQVAGGIGLGLFIARLTMRLHKGDVFVDSCLSSSTTVTIKLPWIRVKASKYKDY